MVVDSIQLSEGPKKKLSLQTDSHSLRGNKQSQKRKTVRISHDHQRLKTHTVLLRLILFYIESDLYGPHAT